MTTKKSSSKPMKFTFRQGLKSVTAAVAVLLCGATTFFTAFFALIELFTSSPTYDDNWNVTGYVANKENYHYLLFPDADYMNNVLMIILAVGGVLAAICTFNFITSKKMVNVYYSLGITRTKLFCGKYFSGLLLIFLAAVIPVTLLFVGNIATVGFTFSLLKATTYYFLKFFLTSATAYAITSAVFAVVGTTFETAVFSAIILFIPDIFLYSIQVLMDRFLYGNPYGNEFYLANEYQYTHNSAGSSLPEKFSYLSPVFWGKEQIAEFAVAKKADAKALVPVISPNFRYALIWLAICAAVFFLAVLFFNKRKAEICGFIGTNRVLNSAVSMLAAFAAFCAVVNLIEDFVLSIVLGAVAFTAVHLLLEIIVLRDMRKFARGLYKLPIGIAVSIGILFIFNTGFFGFSRSVPEVSDIQSVAVTYVGTGSEYGLFSDGYAWQYQELGYYEHSNCMAGEFKTEKDIKAVVEAHKSIAEKDESQRTLENEIQFVYTLKNGKTVKRSFNAVSPESYKKLLYLEDSDYYTETLINYFKGEIKEFKTYDDSPEYVFSTAQKTLRESYAIKLYSRYINKEFEVSMTESDKAKLLDALYKDLLERSVDEKYYPEETPVAFIYFMNQYNYDGVSEYLIPADETTFTETEFSAKYAEDFCYNTVWNPSFTAYITTDMTNTVQVLKDMGLYEKLTAAPEFVSAKVVDATEAYNIASSQAYSYTYAYFSRCYLAKYSAAQFPSGQNWSNYENNVATASDGISVTDKKVIDELLKCSYTVYEQDEIGKGWFVSFKTAEGDELLCYIPEGKLPASVK